MGQDGPHSSDGHVADVDSYARGKRERREPNDAVLVESTRKRGQRWPDDRIAVWFQMVSQRFPRLLFWHDRECL